MKCKSPGLATRSLIRPSHIGKPSNGYSQTDGAIMSRVFSRTRYVISIRRKAKREFTVSLAELDATRSTGSKLLVASGAPGAVKTKTHFPFATRQRKIAAETD